MDAPTGVGPKTPPATKLSPPRRLTNFSRIIVFRYTGLKPQRSKCVLPWVWVTHSLGGYVIDVCERQQKSIRREIRVSSQGWKSNNYYTWERSDIHLPAGTFESMFFLYPKDRICQLGYSSRVLDWNTHILASHGTQKLCTGYSPVFWWRLPSWWITTYHLSKVGWGHEILQK